VALRVGFDAGPLLEPQTGVGRYARELSNALDAQGVEVKRFAVALRGDSGPDIKRLRVPARLAQWSWRHLGRPRIEQLTGDVDVVHGTNFVLPALGTFPGVVTVHDLSFFRSDTFPGGERLRSLVPWSLDRAARVIVPTRAVSDELVDKWPGFEGRTRVVHEGVSPVFFGSGPLADSTLQGMGIRRPFVLAVGALEPRKNLSRLLQAWRIAADELAGWTLVIAGPPGWGPDLPRTENTVLTGWIGDSTLPGLLSAAEFFCYPSLYEGFGLPPLEAMATGTPVLAGRYSCAREVLGDAARLVEPTDTEAVAASLAELATDSSLRQRFALAGRAHATGFTWEKAARQTISVYEEAVVA
jgi:glycosyltransferase involved in cell wall biosynthesis